MIGTHLTAHLRAKGHVVTHMVRREPKQGEIEWHPKNEDLPRAQMEGFEAVVHLSGKNVGQRWTERVKRQMYESRVNTTKLLADTIAGLSKKPEVFFVASAIGIYGARGEEELTDESKTGSGFLANLGKDWEDASKAAAASGVRVVNGRFGLVLSKEGGMLQRMLLPFGIGIGGKFGDGKQVISWIEINDLVAAITFCLENRHIHGPINITSPNPVTNEELSRALARVLRRPMMLTVPKFALRAMFGDEMANETLLSGQRAIPEKLLRSGFEFRRAEIESALRAALS